MKKIQRVPTYILVALSEVEGPSVRIPGSMRVLSKEVIARSNQDKLYGSRMGVAP